jgi:hypothetical protein
MAMEFMHIVYSHEFRLWGIQFLAVLFLAGGLALFAVGLGLVLNSPATLRFFAVMNRWVYLRRVLQPAAAPGVPRPGHSYRLWLAAIFVAGGAFAIFGLVTRFDVRAVSVVFGLEVFRPVFATWLVESARWVLIVGNLTGIIVGVMLIFFPDALITLETRGSRWYSARQPATGVDAMNLTLDKWVAAFPRAAGWIITLFALLLVGAFGLMLAAIR